ncbi:hypothetical protein J3R03_005996 [Actinoplanes couchii]|uniref:Uncharacterized protein n=1 Tax=Actinoplanes couchii TaxID=403638 RepID=A0ABQ3XFJ9_9ACTN|nr:hypothetical protein [Actinoplanes couchii]GID57243.1 hypothetical protein Aco03nite_056470 [Actinoplanes couchii]
MDGGARKKGAEGEGVEGGAGKEWVGAGGDHSGGVLRNHFRTWGVGLILVYLDNGMVAKGNRCHYQVIGMAKIDHSAVR